MKFSLAVLAALSASASASALLPLEIVSSRPLDDLEERAVGVGCPRTFTNPVVIPLQIYRVDSTTPDTHYPSNDTPYITPNASCAIFNLYLPEASRLKTCVLEFIFPRLDQIAGPAYTYNAPADGGWFFFQGYTGYGAADNVTWNNQPPPGPAFTNPQTQILKPGNAYTLNVPFPGSCLFDINGPLEVGGRMCSNDTTFIWTQQTSLCPMGLYTEYY